MIRVPTFLVKAPSAGGQAINPYESYRKCLKPPLPRLLRRYYFACIERL